MDLFFDDYWVDVYVVVVDGDEALDFHVRGFGIDVDDCDVGVVGVGEVWWVVDHLCV